MSGAGILPCLYDTRPPVNSSKQKQRRPAYKTCCPAYIQVFMGIKTTGSKSDLKRDRGPRRNHVLRSPSPLPLMASLNTSSLWEKMNVRVYSDLFSTHLYSRDLRVMNSI